MSNCEIDPKLGTRISDRGSSIALGLGRRRAPVPKIAFSANLRRGTAGKGRMMVREFYLKNPTPPGAAQAT